MPQAVAAKQAFDGDTGALEMAEGEARRLADKWFEWFEAEGHGTPSVCRLDFLVSAEPRSAVQPKLWTVEVCECGGSLCHLPHGARTVAVLNEVVAGEDPAAP